MSRNTWSVVIHMSGYVIASLCFTDANGIRHTVDGTLNNAGIERLNRMARECNQGHVIYNTNKWE